MVPTQVILKVSKGIARYVTAHAPTQGADAGMYDAFSEIHKFSTVLENISKGQNGGSAEEEILHGEQTDKRRGKAVISIRNIWTQIKR